MFQDIVSGKKIPCSSLRFFWKCDVAENANKKIQHRAEEDLPCDNFAHSSFVWCLQFRECLENVLLARVAEYK